MADRRYRAQVSIPRRTTLPEDIVVNTWHFQGVGIQPESDDVDLVVDKLVEFYNAVNGTGSAVVSFFSRVLDGTLASIKVYTLEDPEPRVPFVANVVFNQLPVGGADKALPEEAAACLSYRAAAVSGQPMARRRGRVYLGPLASLASEVLTNRVRVSAAARDTFATSAQRLVDTDASNVYWAVHSSFHNPLIDGPMPQVDNGWVDDAFDTQRRRGPSATVRSPFTL